MKVQDAKTCLKPKTLEYISRTTKLSKKELYTLTSDEAYDKMLERGAIKKPNPVKVFFKNLYKSIGDKLGLLEKNHNFYTHID